MSSSSSSSVSEDGEYWHYESKYDRNFRNAYGKNPFTMGHPLLYYAQVPQPVSWKNRGRKRRRGSPNCFVKAFRWYTEEHLPNRANPTQKADRPNMTGFATWLDSKYDQFLQESQMSSETYNLKQEQTATIETERVDRSVCDEQVCTPKRYRLKKSNQSFQYILQPKDLSRPGSICCHPSYATVTLIDCPNKPLVKSQSYSNTTIRSKEAKAEIKPVGEEIGTTLEKEARKPSTKDFGCQYCEPSLPKIDVGIQCDLNEPSTSSCFTQQSVPNNDCGCQFFDTQKIEPNFTVPSRESAPIPEQSCCQSLDRMPRKPAKKVPQIAPKRDQTKKVSNKVDNECQCLEQNVVKADVQTHYDKGYSRLQSASCWCDLQEFKQSSPPQVQCTSTSNLCNCERKMMGEPLQQRMYVAVKLEQKTAQTSNHSIRLVNPAVNEYPFFMKIVCADKLSDENVKWCSK